MSQFTTRVLLHDATISHYQVLYSEMEKRKFSDVITSDNGVKFKMPPGEYTSFGDISVSQVRSLAVAAARATRKRHSVFVTEASSRSWVGLPPLAPKVPQLLS